MKKWIAILICLVGLLLCATPAVSADIAYSTGKLTWEAPTSGGAVAGYYVNYGTVSGTYTYKQDVGNVLTIQINVLQNITLETVWYFTVSAYNEAGEGPKSNEVNGKITNIPAQPTNVRLIVN